MDSFLRLEGSPSELMWLTMAAICRLLVPTTGASQTFFHESPTVPPSSLLKHYVSGFQPLAHSCHSSLLRITLDFVVLTGLTRREFKKFDNDALEGGFGRQCDKLLTLLRGEKKKVHLSLLLTGEILRISALFSANNEISESTNSTFRHKDTSVGNENKGISVYYRHNKTCFLQGNMKRGQQIWGEFVLAPIPHSAVTVGKKFSEKTSPHQS